MVRAEAIRGVLSPSSPLFLVRSGLFSSPFLVGGGEGAWMLPLFSRRSRLARPCMLVICRQSLFGHPKRDDVTTPAQRFLLRQTQASAETWRVYSSGDDSLYASGWEGGELGVLGSFFSPPRRRRVRKSTRRFHRTSGKSPSSRVRRRGPRPFVGEGW